MIAFYANKIVHQKEHGREIHQQAKAAKHDNGGVIFTLLFCETELEFSVHSSIDRQMESLPPLLRLRPLCL